MDQTTRELTYGEKAVGITFNVGGSALVNEIKQAYADIIDLLNHKRAESTSQEAKRHYSVAITDAETAQMRAVKAVTWSH